MEEKDITVKDIVDKDEKRFRKAYDFYRGHKVLIVVLIVALLGASYGFYRYREYVRRKQTEQMIQQKIEEIMNSTGTDIQQIEDIFNDEDVITILEHLDIEQIMQMLQQSGEVSQEDLNELIQMFNNIDQIDVTEFFTVP